MGTGMLIGFALGMLVAVFALLMWLACRHTRRVEIRRDDHVVSDEERTCSCCRAYIGKRVPHATITYRDGRTLETDRLCMGCYKA